MLRTIIFLGLMVPTIAVASMSAQEELEVIKDAIIEINDNPNHPSADKVGMLVATMNERLEFMGTRLDRDDDQYVIVNIGSQRLTIVKGETAIDSQKVIVGRDSRKTPIFSDKIRYIVTQPYWNVPRSLAVRDVIPKLVKKPELQKYYGYEMIEIATNRVVRFNPSADLRRYRMRQLPGPKNALGQIKFMFDPVPNRAVYLHDTPDTKLFVNDVRRYSSGCVRLEDPDRFGRFLMGNKKVPSSKVKDRWLKIPQAVTVHMVDWAVYVNESGEIVLNDNTGETFKSLSTIESQEIKF